MADTIISELLNCALLILSLCDEMMDFSNTISQIIHNTAPFKMMNAAHQKHLEETETTDSMTEFHDQQCQRQQ